MYKRQVIGSATVYLDGYEVGTVDLVTHKEYVSDFRTDTKATVLLLCALLFILAALMAVTLAAEMCIRDRCRCCCSLSSPSG